jgi:hypothetical protein
MRDFSIMVNFSIQMKVFLMICGKAIGSFLVMFLFVLPCTSTAEEVPLTACSAWDWEAPYTKGRFSIQAIAGAVYSPFLINKDRTTVNYVQTDVRFGWMLNTPTGASMLRGNFQALAEISNSFVTKGPGNYISGVTAVFRYNFVQPDARLVPYVQAGVGVVLTDIHKYEDGYQLTSQALNFTPQGSVGARYMAGKNWSIDMEAMFHHVSNAGLGDSNAGINSGGILLGFTYFFGPP